MGQGVCYFKDETPISFAPTANQIYYVAAILAADYDAAGDTYYPSPHTMVTSSTQASSSSFSRQSTSSSTVSTSSTPIVSYGSSSSSTTTSMSISRTTTLTTTTSLTLTEPTTVTTSTIVTSTASTTAPPPYQATSSSSTTTSSTSTLSTKYLVLASPTPCSFGDPPGTDEDDDYCAIPLPFPLTLYTATGTTIYASTNGFVSLRNGSSQYQTSTLPNAHIPPNSMVAYGSDLYLYGAASPPQGISYQVNATAFTVEYYLGRYQGGGSQLYHFTIEYAIANPGVYVYTYYSVGGSTDDGLMGVVGSQGTSSTGTELGFTYSYMSKSITPGLVLGLALLLRLGAQRHEVRTRDFEAFLKIWGLGRWRGF
ncbi:hypothetical protein LTR62_001673 [Meristemomyces frigidus]|uniref:Uncharacterized protein n=1 Tax=Meristemomyces frigidus TaxID=1508187 RepID=A0AAN7T8V7_9PEZI|nr:hypothetical protein LTR62_001673 [Meristemomyces frigidus]